LAEIFLEGGQRKKKPKINKKYRKIALFSLFQGGPTEKKPKIAKKAENSTFIENPGGAMALFCKHMQIRNPARLCSVIQISRLKLCLDYLIIENVKTAIYVCDHAFVL